MLVALLAAESVAIASDVPGSDRNGPVEITADEIVYDVRSQVYVAEGSVRIEQSDRSLEADWVVFDRETQRGIASGAVVLIDAEEKLEARFLEFDNTTSEGLVFRGRLDMGPEDFVIGAEELVKTGKDTYRAHDASFSTCRCDDPEDRLPWQVNAEDGTVEVGGYAVTKNTSIDILGVPAIWLPWMAFPVKTERQSGFLFPEIGYQSRNGFELGIPYFFAARENVNVTVVPRYLSITGFKPEVEIEAVYGEKSETEILASYIRDQDPEKSHRQGTPDGLEQNVSGVDRWALGFDNDAYLPYDLRARSNIVLVSDNEYPRDFADFDEYRRDRFLESSAFVFRHFTDDGSAALVAGGAYLNDRQNPDYEDRDKFVLQRAPTITGAWLPSPVPETHGFTFAFDTDYTYFKGFERADNALDLGPLDPIGNDGTFLDIGIGAIPFADLPVEVTSDPQRLELIGYDNGRFDEGEPINDEGHRLLLYPRLSRSFRVFEGIDVTPEVGWQQALYSTEVRNADQRGLFTARTDVSSSFVGEVDLPWLGSVEHVLEPEVGWALVQRQGQQRNPLLVPATAVPQNRLRQLSLDNVVLDTADRIDSANVLTAGFGNRFYGEHGATRRLLGDFQASFGYDFAGQSAGHLEDMILEAHTLHRTGFGTHSIFSLDMEDGTVEESLFDIDFPQYSKLPLVKSIDLGLGYRYRRDIPLFYEFFPTVNAFKKFDRNFQHINQISARVRTDINDRWAIGGNVMFSVEEGILQQNEGFLEYTSACRCWAARVDVNHSRTRGPQANFRIAILGFGNRKGSPFAGAGIGTSVAD